jgi:hypothetical protein
MVNAMPCAAPFATDASISIIAISMQSGTCSALSNALYRRFGGYS